ncbi:MAG: ATP-binding cassette domain-containing protein [candidate division Zixibacteria bacterium]|nr:ATP-binding cassette domain-containing protein [candidate division Zixibacteria bacterium]
MIKLDHVHKVYDTGKIKVEALRGVDLDVRQGEFLTLVGPSGSGKSTLMNILGCLDSPTEGTYYFRGEQVQGLSLNRLAEIRNRRVGFVFQNFNLLPFSTALENVELPMVFGGVPTRERRKRGEEVLERVGLGDRMDHKPTELSGGQMQRVAIARALVNHPDLILADEPTGNLDTASGQEIVNLFEELWKAGHTIMIITHDPNLPMRTERTLHMRDGSLHNGNGEGQ